MIDILTGVQSTAAALDAEQTRLNVISENIANADTTHGPDGKPYRRQMVVFESALQQAMNGQTVPTLRVAAIEKDLSPLQMIYDPGNPDANAQGMVEMPNVNVQEEMADLISASRTYEANLAVVHNARALADQTMAMDKH
ncbi:MAG TPA: flagellar basal body rod protein FlgC [Candidatus Saccharimonadales bacterium]|nr:flagellar basal body rod protein FlgC [Candidatus Saccharimonadales bacterium]